MEYETEHKLSVRNLQPGDYRTIKKITSTVYGTIAGGPWSRDEYRKVLSLFPKGQICIEDKGTVVAAAFTLIVDSEAIGDTHTYVDVVGNATFKGHDPQGDYLYGIDVFVAKSHRGLRLGRRLYDARKELCEHLNLKGILAGGRIPGYHKYRDQLTPRQYLERVKSRDIVDPVLTFQIANDFHVKQVLRDYIPDDDESCGNAVLLEWINIFYAAPEKKLVWGRKSNVRLGVVQWQMRPMKTVEELMQQVEFFIDAVSGYAADLVLLPELFNAPLLAEFNQEDTAEAMRSLADYTEAIRDELLKMAVTYNINIVAGSLPLYHRKKLYNVAHLCRRDGTWDTQHKLHITPDEEHYWGLKGGKDLKVFDTDVGKIGLLICFDVEFPELSRLLIDQGANILLVPFLTDTKNAYLRVRRCAQARAIENECYVAISGSVGNLPKVENMDIQYSQAAIFTPSDFAFPHDAVAAEATPNTEMTLIADLDLDLLKEIREQGAVRNLESRRKDLYAVHWKNKHR